MTRRQSGHLGHHSRRSLKIRFTFTIVLLLILGLSISCGGESDTPPSDRPPVPDPNVVRMNGGCTDERFLDAEWAAYQALLRAREEAARILKEKIDQYEEYYKERKSKLNTDYVRDLNQCANNTSCSEKAKIDYDDYIQRAQVVHDDGIYVVQGNELAAKEQAQQDYEAAVKEAREKFCRRSYSASGSDGPVVYSGTVCSLEKDFTITGTHPLMSFPFEFVPSSPTSGTVSYSTSGSGVTASGSGTYRVEGVDTDSPRIIADTKSTASIPVKTTSGGGTATITLVPLETDECK